MDAFQENIMLALNKAIVNRAASIFESIWKIMSEQNKTRLKILIAKSSRL